MQAAQHTLEFKKLSFDTSEANNIQSRPWCYLKHLNSSKSNLNQTFDHDHLLSHNAFFLLYEAWMHYNGT